jgi:hypothetical protein
MTEQSEPALENTIPTFSYFRLAHRWLRARRNPTYIALWISLVSIGGSTSNNYAPVAILIIFIATPLSDSFMFNDRHRSSAFAWMSLFSLGMSGLYAQHFTSENLRQGEFSHHSLQPLRKKLRVDAKNLKNRNVRSEIDADIKNLNNKKVTRREKIEKRIEASHRPMSGIQLFNRWLRARRNPLYGLIYFSIIYFIYRQNGWAMVGYLVLFALVIFPILMASDFHLDDLRNFGAAIAGLSFLTLGFAGLIAQYATRDGSIPNQKSLSNPATLLASLRDKERRQKVKIIRFESHQVWAAQNESKKEIQRLNTAAMDTIVHFVEHKEITNRYVNYADINRLCGITLFMDHEQPEIRSFLNSEAGSEFAGSEFKFWLFLLHDKLKNATSNKEIRKLISRKKFQLLKEVYINIPAEVGPATKLYLHKTREQRVVQNAIDRKQLPELRIIQLNLRLPRYPQNAEDFEHICADWLRAWGEDSVVVTQQSGDGGIDIRSTHCVAQVKFYSNKLVGRPELQALQGAAHVSGGAAVFFGYNGFTDEAVHWAEQANMFLFQFNANTGRFISPNSYGTVLVEYLADLVLQKSYESENQ